MKQKFGIRISRNFKFHRRDPMRKSKLLLGVILCYPIFNVADTLKIIVDQPSQDFTVAPSKFGTSCNGN